MRTFSPQQWRLLDLSAVDERGSRKILRLNDELLEERRQLVS
jgi:hypothetical protein